MTPGVEMDEAVSVSCRMLIPVGLRPQITFKTRSYFKRMSDRELLIMMCVFSLSPLLANFFHSWRNARACRGKFSSSFFSAFSFSTSDLSRAFTASRYLSCQSTPRILNRSKITLTGTPSIHPVEIPKFITITRTTTETQTKIATTTLSFTVIPTPSPCSNTSSFPIQKLEIAQTVPSGQQPTAEESIVQKLGGAGIRLIFKTGSQVLHLLSLHLATTLRYLTPSEILFFSDAHSTLGPHTLHDALRNVDQSLRETHPDFAIYRKIKGYQETGRDVN